MIPMSNIKVKECCCGCTLRTGSLILLWISLIVECMSVLIYLYELVYGNQKNVHIYSYYHSSVEKSSLLNITVLTCRSLYYLTTSITGVAFSILGIYAIQMEVPKFLTCSMYYLSYYVVYVVFSIFVMVFLSPDKCLLLMNGQKTFGMTTSDSESIFVTVMAHLFIIAALLYFFVVLRSCRDSMLRNLSSGRSNEIPDPSCLGYHVA